MTIEETLQDYVFRSCQKLDLPVFFRDEAGIAPKGPWSLMTVEDLAARAAGLGRFAPMRFDGAVKLAITSRSGDSGCVAARLAGFFPYGLSLSCKGPQGSGEIILAAPKTGQADNGKTVISIGFYAILFRED